MSTPTPRSDYEEQRLDAWQNGERFVKATFARTLETELTAALARVGDLEKEVSRWHKSFDGHVYVKSSEYAERALERESLTRQLSESQESLRLSQHDAAQERLRIVKLEGLLSEAQAQLASAREVSARLDAWVKTHKPRIWLDAGLWFVQSSIDPEICGTKESLRSAIDAARGHLAETPAGGETGKDAWQDIATAPKDGNDLFLYDQNGTTIGYFSPSLNRWVDSNDKHEVNFSPLGWQSLPLPPPPQGKEQE